jgi:predicted permease
MMLPLARKVAGALGIITLAGIGLYARANGITPERVSQYGTYSPARLVARAALSANDLNALGALIALALAAFGMGCWTFRVSLSGAEVVRARRHSLLAQYRMPGRFGALAAKDFRQYRRLLDPYLGALMAVLCGIYLMNAEALSPVIFWAFIVAVFVPNASVAFNSFGLDARSDLERYLLLPLSGRDIIGGKNIAFAMIIGAQVLPVVLIAWARMGVFVAFVGIIVIALLCLAHLAWGNWASVHHPFKMRSYRFSNGGSPFEVMVGIVFGCLPAVVAISFLQAESIRSIAIAALILTAYIAVYFVALTWTGKRFERRREEIARALL